MSLTPLPPPATIRLFPPFKTTQFHKAEYMSTAFPIQHLGANIEIYSAPPIRGLIQHVVFDFDGTLSLIRAGWQEIMLSLCVKALERTPTAKDRATLTDICHGFILQLPVVRPFTR